MAGIDWLKSASYDADQKALFHREAKKRLRQLAVELKLKVGSFDLRSNAGGIAVSGEVTLHHERVYVQVSQSCMGRGSADILVRSCEGRKDYCGGQKRVRPHSNARQHSKACEHGGSRRCA
jgi:hypothetical protein